MIYEPFIIQPVTAAVTVAVLFLFGAVIGSFIDVVRVRESWKSSLRGRSRCTNCGSALTWQMLVPIVSYIYLRGKCASCKYPIPSHHLLSEILMGLAFASSFFFADSLYIAGIGIISAVFLVPIVISDIEKMEVPEYFSVPFAYISLGVAIVITLQTGSIVPVLGGVLLAVPFFLIWLCSSGRAMGLGDAKVAVSLGFLLPVWHATISVFVFTFWISTLGLLCYVLYMKTRVRSFRLKRNTRMPLVPGMVVAYAVVLFSDVSFFNIVSWGEQAFISV